jgi:hypothetical protein
MKKSILRGNYGTVGSLRDGQPLKMKVMDGHFGHFLRMLSLGGDIVISLTSFLFTLLI